MNQKSVFIICLLFCLFLLLCGCSSKKNKQQEKDSTPAIEVAGVSTPNNLSQSQISHQNTSNLNETAAKAPTKKYKSLADLLKQSPQNNPGSYEPDLSEQSDEQLISNAISILSADKDKDNRIEAIEELYGFDISQVLPVIEIAIKDKDSDVRLSAVSILEESISSQEHTTEFFIIADRNVKPLISKALSDNNEDVRTAAFMAAENLPLTIRLDILKTAITSEYIDVKQEAISQLTDLSTPAAFEILILGLRYIDPELKEDIDFATDFMISQEFNSYEDARKWWAKNKYRFDENLVELETEP